MPKNQVAEEADDFDRPLGYAELPARGEIVRSAPRSSVLKSSHGEATFTDEQLKQLNFFEVAKEADRVDDVLGQDQFGPLLDKSTKNRLVGLPFIAVKWEFHKGMGTDGEFVSVWILTEQNARYILNDGGTGVYAQLKAYTAETGRNSMLRCDRGLSRSDYDHPEFGPAITYYIDTKLMA